MTDYVHYYEASIALKLYKDNDKKRIALEYLYGFCVL